MYVTPDRFSPRRLMDWILQRMSEDRLPNAMRKLMADRKNIYDFPSLALYLHKRSQPATEIVDFFTPNAFIELFSDLVTSKSREDTERIVGDIEEVHFPDGTSICLSDYAWADIELQDLIKKYFSDYLKNLYNQYFEFESFGAYQDFRDMKRGLVTLRQLVADIETISTSPSREDFQNKLKEADSVSGHIGKLAENMLNNFFYCVREVCLHLEKQDILEKYERKEKHENWSWAKKERTLRNFCEDSSLGNDNVPIQYLKQIVNTFLKVYLISERNSEAISQKIAIVQEKIRICRNKSAHQKLGLQDVITILRSFDQFITQIESVIPRCCFVLRAKFSPWITVLELRMEGEETVKEAFYMTRDFDKYTYFFKYEDIIRASENYELFFALPTGSSSYNQYFILPYGKISSDGKVERQYNFGSQDIFRKLGITVTLSQDSPIEYVRIQDRESA